MKYYQLFIQTDNSKELYNSVTTILGLQPTEDEAISYEIWMYCISEAEDEPTVDFINIFLDILEPNFEQLEQLGITKDNINFWLIYEYDKQCGLEFHPQEMARLGQNGIHLCIDCYELN